MVDLQVNTLVLKVEACNSRRTSSNLSLTGGGTPKRMPMVIFFYHVKEIALLSLFIYSTLYHINAIKNISVMNIIKQ